MSNIDDKIKKIFSQDLELPQSYKDTIKNSFKEMEYKKQKNFKLAFATVGCSLFLVTGVVFAKDIENFIKERLDFGLGKGVETAVNNGYVGKSEMDFVEQEVSIIQNDTSENLDKIKTKVKLDKFTMDETTLSIDFSFEFDNKINDYVDLGKINENGNIDYENSHRIELTDVFILDEENRLLYVPLQISKDKFNEFCKEHNLDFNYEDYNYRTFSNSLITEIEHTEGKVLAKLEYHFYSEDYPESKELYIYFNEISLTPKLNEETKKSVKLTGNWEMHVDVPEEIYNRSAENYKVTKCDNEDFNVYEAKATETGFEIGLTISNLEQPIYPEELSKMEQEFASKNNGIFSYPSYTEDGLIQFYGSEEYKEMYEEFKLKNTVINIVGNPVVPWIEKKAEGCYILNSNGDKFICKSTLRKQKYAFIDEHTYDFYETFEMTKYDATDKITVVIDYYDTPVYIELEKIP